MLTKNEDGLRVLGVFHIIFGAIIALLGLIPLVPVLMGTAIIGTARRPEDAAVGVFLAIIGGFVILIWEACAIALIIAGRCLMRQRCYVFCMVMAVLLCLFFPLGTILGVLTIILLLQDDVRATFG